MTESHPAPAESGPELPVPIAELVDGISDTDVDLLTRIALSDQQLSKTADDLRFTMSWAMDQAFTRPHATAQELREHVHGELTVQALQLAQEVERSGIAYRISANQKLDWMTPITDRARIGIRDDYVYMNRKDAYQREPNATWLYRKMQSRLLVCLAWMAEGREMERRDIRQGIRERIARELATHLWDNTDGI